ncbi:hypothetical protein [Mucilaginibacter arboris]|uniref:Uncharacterized protein n=1 Tax=Mucilaginibacter arboris TaxID=2682090 RepID=A0A7K1SVW7_9SPHI|nr:hypothetical protein [Mucilaginibacter arboris]MVN21472.1 hypothetical protein [Mucilaginibacter arboris]
MKTELLKELSVLHTKVAALKVYDSESAALLKQYNQEFEAILTRLLAFNADRFKALAASHHKKTIPETHDVDVHDDTASSHGFYDSVADLNNCINDSIGTMNSI